MVKFIIAAHRRPGMLQSEAHHHLEHVHGGLVKADPDRIVRYVQNHVFDGAYGTPNAGWSGFAERNSVAEIWFENLEDHKVSTYSEYYRTVLQPDEPNFADQTNLIVMITREVELSLGSLQNAPLKVLHYLKRDPQQHRNEFLERWQAFQNQLLEQAEPRAQIRRAVQSVPLFESPITDPSRLVNFYDTVLSLYFDDLNSLNPYREAFSSLEQTQPELFDLSKSFLLLAKEVILIPDRVEK